MFYETPRFPDYLAYGLLVGPEFMSDVVRAASGAESRNQRWDHPLRVFDGSTTHRTTAERTEIDSFFRVVAKGRVNGFRIKDWSDYTATISQGVVSLLATPADTYQMKKRYTSGAYTYDQPIYKPVSGSLTISGGGTYTVDYTAGTILRVSGAAPTAWSGEYDTPARFDHDELKWEVQHGAGGYMFLANTLKIRETRDAD